ncbi:siderophore-interacting protein [Marinomonas ostreistagni]|uniref:siderophore-interacting protein n=1 Tax=Marinomonas ostreistagni TaxID=359209 RepID=UPI00194EDD2F|nr:siderophore-interacting protein [Marinomonas ostreistagni]MBM6551791.1 siderophore-interacting protein [Marinomonas ostreistagni]
MAKPEPRLLSVIRKSFITPNMLRLTLGGAGLKDFPEDQESGYVKLIFPVDGGRLMRTYTIRHQRADEIDIDFAIHGDTGVACHWALHAQPGEEILVGGPGPKKLASEAADWNLFIGDMTSLPAISVNLGQLSKNAKGYALLEVQSEDDIQQLDKPEGITIKWIVNPTPGADSESLLNHVKQLDWLDGSLAVWAACEFSSMRALRQYFKGRDEVSKSDIYVSSYWKHGLNEDQHKVEKRIDLDANQVA